MSSAEPIVATLVDRSQPGAVLHDAAQVGARIETMLRAGATATMEAWTVDEKPNLSWSHPWASAPASAVVWGLFGIRATEPGWRSIVVKPQPGNLSWASIRVPSLRGPVEAAFNQTSCGFNLTLRLPGGVQAEPLHDARSRGRSAWMR